jgi:hypothetical protein
MSNEKKSLDPNTVIVAVIGLIGTIVAALIGVYGRGGGFTSSPATATVAIVATSVPAQATDAIAPTLAISAPTNTLEPTATTVAPVDIGADWADGCISTLWKPVPADTPVTDKGNGCWQEPVGVFTADNGTLFVSSQRGGRGDVENIGLFVKLPESGKVSFSVLSNKLDGVDFVMGVFTAQDINSNGLLMAIPGASNLKSLNVVKKDNLTGFNTAFGSANLDQGNGFPITLAFSESSVSGSVDPFVFIVDPIQLPSAEKWLYIGFRTREGAYSIDVQVKGLTLQ